MKPNQDPLPRAQTLGELMDESLLRQAVLAREIVVEDQCFVFKCAADYWISFDRIDTAPKLLSWVRHLMEKNWMTPERMKFFIDLVGETMRFPVRLSN
jgi:hypothetical protein